MKNYDWIVIGGGITGSALSYELAKKGLAVLLLDKDPNFNNATRFSYGGLAYWSGTNQLSRQLCQESIEIHRSLSEELEGNTEFRDIDLLLTINPEDDPKIVAQNYDKFAIKPQLLSPQEAYEIEPLLNPHAISGALKLPHGHIHTQKTNEAYQKAFLQLGGELKFQKVEKLLRQDKKIEGVATPEQKYYAKNTVVCAGGLSRFLLKEAGITVNIYFTHAQVIITPPVELQLRTLVMPAVLKRLNLEAQTSHAEMNSLWSRSNPNLMADVVEPGAIQFLDGSFCIGQISQICSDPIAKIDRVSSETRLRTEVGKILPILQDLPGNLYQCLVAFAATSSPLVGKLQNFTGLYLFSGFTSTLVFAPPLARHFASWVSGEKNRSFLEISEQIPHQD